jgi:3alpha(or 20beta)-hydroxysteroid dehydrogenase
MGRLKNKIALITGGCGDIGFATAEIFVREGARVIIADIRDTEGMKLQEQLGVSYVHLDVGVEVQWEKFGLLASSR